MRPTAPTLHRRVRALLAGFLLLSTLTTAGVAMPAVASAAPTATTGEDEAGFLTAINRDRTAAGLAALVSDPKLASTSRSWSQNMASRNQLYHDQNLAAVAGQVDPNWRSIGENVGVGYSVPSLHTAFMNSPGHRANVMKPAYNRVGIGVVHAGGKIWVTVRFLQGPAISGTTGLGPPPPPPGVRTALSGDFDGNGFDDVFTYGPGTQGDELWFGQASHEMHRASVSVSGQYRPVAGDFNGNGRTDILWYAPGPTADYLWQWNGTAWSSTTKTVKGTYTPRAGDFDGDGVDDILWYAAGATADSRWYGNRDGTFTSSATQVDGLFYPAVGNVDGTGGDDIIWYGPGSAPDRIWYSTSRRGAQRSVAASFGGAHAPFTGDFDGNGSDDIVWYTAGSAADSVWHTSTTPGAYVKSVLDVAGSYLPGTGDFDGNRADDILWFSPSSAAGDPLWWGATAGAESTSTLRAA
jgi:Cysteine-rich secretory protein family/FG-GAP-like repeat